MQIAIESLITVRELAEHLRISLATAYVLIKQGSITAYRVGGKRGAIRVKQSDVMEYLLNGPQASRPTKQVTTPGRTQLKHIKLK